MKQLLVVDSSARVSRSLSRALTERAVDRFRSHCPDARIVHRDVGRWPVPALDEAWIAAAFAPPGARSAIDDRALAASEELVDELVSADAVVMGAPIYNFGLPAQLKAWIDQVVRIGRTFEYGTNSDEPYRPLLRRQPVLVATSAGTTAMFPSGPWYASNFLEPQLVTLCAFIGLGEPAFVRIGGAEDPEGDIARCISEAHHAIDGAVDLWFPSARGERRP